MVRGEEVRIVTSGSRTDFPRRKSIQIRSIDAGLARGRAHLSGRRHLVPDSDGEVMSI